MRPGKLIEASRGTFGLGVFLVVGSLFAFYIQAGPRLWSVAALVLGGLAVLLGIALSLRESKEFLKTWWLGIAVCLTGLLVLYFADDLADLLSFEGIKLWVVLFGLMFAVDALLFTLWRLALRALSPETAPRAGAAANVALVGKLAVVLLVVVNWFGANHLSRWVGTMDTTETSVYSLGDLTRQILDELDDRPGRITATYVDFGTNSMFAARRGEEPLGNRGKEFLAQYGDYSAKVDVEVFDGVQEMGKLVDHFRKLGITEPNLGTRDTVVFTYGEPGQEEPNRKDIEVDSWSFMERSPLGTKKFKGEQLYTSAIQDILLPKKKAYFVTGHGEYPLSGGRVNLAQAAEVLRQRAMDVDTLSLTETSRVPEDADVLVIAGPTKPLLPNERDTLVRWLDRGGSMVLLFDPDGRLMVGDERFRFGLEDWLTKMGVTPRTEFVCMVYDIAKGSTGSAALKTRQIQTADYSFHPIVEDLDRQNLTSWFLDASPVLAEKPETATDLTVEELVYVPRYPGPGLESLRSYAARLYPGRVPEEEDPGQDLLDRRLPVAVAAEKKLGETEEDGLIRVVVFGQSGFATTLGMNDRSMYYAPGNGTLFANAVTWAMGREELLAIDPKTLETETVTLSDLHTRLARTVGVWVIPIFVLLAGLGVAWARRR